MFGITSLVDGDYAPSPLALGELTYGVTVREMAQAYTVFANNGVFTESRTYTQVLDSHGGVVLDNPVVQRQALRPNAANNVTDMMIGSVTGGTSASARFSGQEIAGKTGSSGGNDDRWFVGMTPYYVAAVWTGFDIPAGSIYWSNPSCVTWRTIMQQVHEGLEYRAFSNPSSIGSDTMIFGDLTNPPPPPDPHPLADARPDRGPRNPRRDRAPRRNRGPHRARGARRTLQLTAFPRRGEPPRALSPCFIPNRFGPAIPPAQISGRKRLTKQPT